MKIQVIKCDSCKNEIVGNPYRIFIDETDRDTGDILIGDYAPTLKKMDFCKKCVSRITAFALDLNKKVKAKSVDEPADSGAQDAEQKSGEDSKASAIPDESKPCETRRIKHKAAPSYEQIKPLRDQGKSIREIADQLGSPYSTVSRVIRIHEDTSEEERTKPDDDTDHHQEEKRAPASEEKEPATEEKKPEKDNSRNIIWEPVTNRKTGKTKYVACAAKQTPKDHDTVKVCKKNCMVCTFSSSSGYCDYMSITGKERNDKPGICTHRELR